MSSVSGIASAPVVRATPAPVGRARQGRPRPRVWNPSKRLRVGDGEACRSSVQGNGQKALSNILHIDSERQALWIKEFFRYGGSERTNARADRLPRGSAGMIYYA